MAGWCPKFCLATLAFVLAATPAGAVEGLIFAVVGIGCGKPKIELQCL